MVLEQGRRADRDVQLALQRLPEACRKTEVDDELSISRNAED